MSKPKIWLWFPTSKKMEIKLFAMPFEAKEALSCTVVFFVKPRKI